jgi:hypothetical protein
MKPPASEVWRRRRTRPETYTPEREAGLDEPASAAAEANMFPKRFSLDVIESSGSAESKASVNGLENRANAAIRVWNPTF